MSKSKGAGSTKNVSDSPGQRLGVKIYGGQSVVTGNVIVRQRGTKKVPGPGTILGKDHTIHAGRDGVVKYQKIKKTHFSGKRVPRTQVSVVDA